MTENEPIYIKSLAVRALDSGQARIEAELENRGGSDSPPLLLLINFFDSENRVRDRISIRLKPIKPGAPLSASTVFRLKSGGFFSYSARLEKIV
ncbi:MAG: hypothetical protein WCX65_16340 [bacterium]